MIAGVVLAAGRAERFGSDKMLRDLRGRPLVCHAIGHCLASSLDRVVVVTAESGCAVEKAVHSAFGDASRFSIVNNSVAARGHMTSVKAGLRALPDAVGAVVILLGDMPLVGPEIIERLLEAQRRSGGLVVPRCEQEWRHPRAIPRARFADFLALGDNAGGGAVFDRFRDEVLVLDVGEPWNFLDVDTPEDLARASLYLRD